MNNTQTKLIIPLNIQRFATSSTVYSSVAANGSSSSVFHFVVELYVSGGTEQIYTRARLYATGTSAPFYGSSINRDVSAAGVTLTSGSMYSPNASSEWIKLSSGEQFSYGGYTFKQYYTIYEGTISCSAGTQSASATWYSSTATQWVPRSTMSTSTSVTVDSSQDPPPYDVSINPVATGTTSINLQRSWQRATYCQYNIQSWGWINEGTSYPNGVYVSGNNVTGLSPNTTYSCQVRFGNGNSDLTYSNTVNCTTLADPPTNLQITNLKSYYKNKTSDICISGNVSATSSLTITNYTLYYKRSIDSTYTSKNLGTSTTFELTNLQNNTTYDIYFTVSNSSATATSTDYTQTTLQMYCIKISQNGAAFVTKRMYYSLSGGTWIGIPKDKLNIR